MSRHPAGSINIGGARFDVDVDDDGMWYGYPEQGGRALQASTKDQLRKLLVRATKARRAQVAVPFTKITKYQSPGRGGSRRPAAIEARNGTATGLHSANGNVLIRWDNGETEQLAYFYDHQSVARLTEHEVATWRVLYKAAMDAEIALNAFLAEHEIDLPKATRAAIDAAVAGDEE